MSGDYHKIPIRALPKTSTITGEQRYWQHFKNPVNTKHYSKISDIEFSPLHPYDFAVTSSTRIQIYDGLAHVAKKSLSRFPDVAYSASYRPSDGKVIVAGCEDSKIRVLDLSSRIVLRTLVGHTGAVKSTRFLSESRFILSGGDDTTVRTWDMTTEQNLDVLRGHKDYVRAVSEHFDFSPFCFLSASYDHTVRYWDRRVSNQAGEACCFTLNHGAPIEDLLVLPNHGMGDMLATAGENTIKVWNIRMASSNQQETAASSSSASSSSSFSLSRGALLYRASNHQKTIISLSYDLATDRMLSGGLDHMVKVYDMRPSLTRGHEMSGFESEKEAEAASTTPVSSFATEFMQVTHTMKFSGPILSTAISPDSRVLAVGMADGSLSIRSRQATGAGAKGGIIVPPKPLSETLREDVTYQSPLDASRSASRAGRRGLSGVRFDTAGEDEGEDAEQPDAIDDLRIARVRRQRLKPYDALLKSFKYHLALDASLATKRPTIIISMLDELINRNALVLALANRDANSLMPLLHFTDRYLAIPSYAPLLLDLLHLILDLYTPVLGSVPEFDALIYRLCRVTIKHEVETQKNLITMQAFMDNMTSRSQLRQETDEEEEEEEGVEEQEATMQTEEETHGLTATASAVAHPSVASTPSAQLGKRKADMIDGSDDEEVDRATAEDHQHSDDEDEDDDEDQSSMSNDADDADDESASHVGNGKNVSKSKVSLKQKSNGLAFSRSSQPDTNGKIHGNVDEAEESGEDGGHATHVEDDEAGATAESESESDSDHELARGNERQKQKANQKQKQAHNGSGPTHANGHIKHANMTAAPTSNGITHHPKHGADHSRSNGFAKKKKKQKV